MEIKNATYEINNTLERINSRLDKAKDQIRDLEDKVGKNTQAEQQKEKNNFKNDEGYSGTSTRGAQFDCGYQSERLTSGGE